MNSIIIIVLAFVLLIPLPILVQERKYEFRHGAKTKDGLKNVQEITFAKISVQNLIEYCLGNNKIFKIPDQELF